MSTIRKRKGKWFVEIRKKYFKPIRKTSEYKLDAEKYAGEKQAEIDKGFLVSYKEAQKTKLSELLERYRTEITSKKKGAIVEKAARFTAHAWKACVLLKVSWVRIPLSPPK